MATRKAIQAHFAQYFPQLATVRLRKIDVPLGPSVIRSDRGIKTCRTVAYLLSLNLEGEIVPLSGEVMDWHEITALPWSQRCVGLLYNAVIVEWRIYDETREKYTSNYHLWVKVGLTDSPYQIG